MIFIKVTMRLYKLNDLDLLYLYKLPHFSLQKSIRDALQAYIRNEKYVIDYPVAEEEVIVPKATQFHIYLSEETDYDIINWIRGMSSGYRNSLLKNVIRGYLKSPVVIPYSEKFLSDNVVEKIDKQPSNKKAKPKPKTNKPAKKQPATKQINHIVIPEVDAPVKSKDDNYEETVSEIMSMKLDDANKKVALHEADSVLRDKDEDSFNLFGEFDKMMESL